MKTTWETWQQKVNGLLAYHCYPQHRDLPRRLRFVRRHPFRWSLPSVAAFLAPGPVGRSYADWTKTLNGFQREIARVERERA